MRIAKAEKLQANKIYGEDFSLQQRHGGFRSQLY